MRPKLWKPIILSMASLSLSALVPLTVGAQDQDDHREQRADEHRDDQSRRDEQQNDQVQRDERQNDQVQRDERHDDQTRRDDHHDYNGDQGGQYRHDHPRASARCQDGFFTTTRDRSRACSRHGGVDVWISN